MTDNITTTNMADFGRCEMAEAAKLLTELSENRVPEDFVLEDVQVMMNKQSGFVFLANSEYQVAMMNGDKLESFYTCSNCGHEGFAEDGFSGENKCECDDCRGDDEEEEE